MIHLINSDLHQELISRFLEVDITNNRIQSELTAIIEYGIGYTNIIAIDPSSDEIDLLIEIGSITLGGGVKIIPFVDSIIDDRRVVSLALGVAGCQYVPMTVNVDVEKLLNE